MSERIGDWMCTSTGRKFYPLDPRPEDFDPRDIAHALALENRYCGHLPKPYSVAQHSMMAREIVRDYFVAPSDVQLAALLHDAAEAYIKDIPRPLKRALGESYRKIEHSVEAAIAQRFGLKLPMSPLVKRADNICLAVERRDLFSASHQQLWSAPVDAEAAKRFSARWMFWADVELEFLSSLRSLAGASW